MRTLELIEKLGKIPVFGVNELAKLTGLGAHAVRMLAWRLGKKGIITHIERLKYSILKSELVIAAYITKPSYLGHYSALAFHGMTTQIVNDIDIVAPKSRKPVKINRKIIRFIKTKHFWGFEKYSLDGFDVLISDPEKTIVDCILSGKIKPHIIFEALKSRRLDENKLFFYAHKIENSALMKRLGYLLNKADYQTAPYEKYARGAYARIDKRLPAKGNRNRRWKIIENAVVE